MASSDTGAKHTPFQRQSTTICNIRFGRNHLSHVPPPASACFALPTTHRSLYSNDFTTLPAGIFDSFGALTYLYVPHGDMALMGPWLARLFVIHVGTFVADTQKALGSTEELYGSSSLPGVLRLHHLCEW